jgi:hypothetical protein
MRFFFWKALLGFAAYDLLANGDFGKLHRTVQNWKVKKTVTDEQNTSLIVHQICDSVNLASVWYPKQVLCLQRSAVTTCLLRSCGVSARMVLGAQKLPFKAHAWVEVAGRPVNEMRDVQSVYQVWEHC